MNPTTSAPVVPTEGPAYWRKQHHRMADVLRDHVVDVLRCEAEPHVIADAVEAVREAANMIEAFQEGLVDGNQ